MFTTDVADLRSERQKYNNYIIAEELNKNSPSYSELVKIANDKAIDRLLDELDFDYDDLLTECANSIVFSKTVAIAIAKNASRQGKKDESFIIDGVATEMKKYNYNIRCCGVDELRPCKNGKIMTKKEFKKENLNKDIHALKSIDGIFDGPKSGYIFAKIVIGAGGHQDNVLHEMNQYIEWAKEFGQEDKIYVMLIDGEEFASLKEKQTDNIWVVNHIEFQERLLG
jgi:hypothetical protein